MKPHLLFIAAAGVIALAVRALGPAPAADVAALAYLTIATVAFGERTKGDGRRKEEGAPPSFRY